MRNLLVLVFVIIAMIFNVYFAFAVGLIALAYYYVKRKYSYWQLRGVPSLEAEIPYGNIKQMGRSLHQSLLMKQYYDKMKGAGAFVGFYIIYRPAVLLLDRSLIKNILMKDFTNFNDRGLYVNEKHDPLSAHLFSMDGKKWKNLRAKLTPTFTSGKMKFMYPTIIEVGDRFRDTLKDIVGDEKELEVKDLLARFTTDIIGTCAFGIECNSLKDPDSEFREMGRRVFEEPRHKPMALFLMTTFRKWSNLLGFKVNRDDVLHFFMNVVRETVDVREKNKISRNDFMDLLIKLKNKETDESGLGGLTIEEVAAQTFIFFLAGFETSSTTLAFCLYELATNPEIQEKARQQAREVLKRHDGKFTYEAMMDMQYIDQVIYGKCQLLIS